MAESTVSFDSSSGTSRWWALRPASGSLLRGAIAVYEPTHEDQEAEARHPDELVDGPPPALEHCRETRDDGSEDRPEYGANRPHAHSVRELVGREDVAHRRATGGEDRRTDEAGQESEDEEAREVLREDDRDLEDDEEEQSGPVDRVATEMRCFLQWRKNHCAWAKERSANVFASP